MAGSFTSNLLPSKQLGSAAAIHDPSPLAGATWYEMPSLGDGLQYHVTPGTLTLSRFLTFDLLLNGKFLAVFELQLSAGRGEPFKFCFAALNQCSARVRLPLEATLQNAWMLKREGAFLKPMCGGAFVEIEKVDRIELKLLRSNSQPVRVAFTPIRIVDQLPPPLEQPLLPRGKLLDEFGQSTLHEWPAKTRDEGELVARLKGQLAAAESKRFPTDFTEAGGWKNGPSRPPTGFFTTHHDGKRWWLIDPDGKRFFSAGVDCFRSGVSPHAEGIESALTWIPPADGKFAAAHNRVRHDVNYLAANFIRAFGVDWKPAWCKIALSQLREFGFNTIANWSEIDVAQAAQFPYVRPLHPHWATAPTIFRDFPDVFTDAFLADCETFAKPLESTRNDRALIGYFLMNEPTWGFAAQLPAVGMLINTETCATRDALAAHLQKQYANDAALVAAWKMPVTLAQVQRGKWHGSFSPAALADLETFSTIMVQRLMDGLSAACRKVDPNHLNLGARYYTAPPAWAIRGMGGFDVFSINGYAKQLDAAKITALSEATQRPVMVGEWHFGALDVGLPASGIGHVKDQAARGQAFRVYTESAAAIPACIGVHYFTFYDQSAVGRYDGENYNIGLLDVCNRPYEPLAAAMRTTHERLYRVAAGEIEPYLDAPEYLPLLFM